MAERCQPAGMGCLTFTALSSERLTPCGLIIGAILYYYVGLDREVWIVCSKGVIGLDHGSGMYVETDLDLHLTFLDEAIYQLLMVYYLLQ